MEFEIRKLGTEELHLLSQLLDYHDFDAAMEDNRREMEAGRNEIYAILGDENTLLGELHIAYENGDKRFCKPGKRAYFFAFRVHESMQGKGLGQKLMDYTFNTPSDPLRSVDCVKQRCELIAKNLEYMKK